MNTNDGSIYDNSWMPVVGINDYENESDSHYAVEGARAIKNKLINDLWGFTEKMFVT